MKTKVYTFVSLSLLDIYCCVCTFREGIVYVINKLAICTCLPLRMLLYVVNGAGLKVLTWCESSDFNKMPYFILSF